MNGYNQELFAQKTPYLQWLKAQESELGERYGRQLDRGAVGKQMHTLPFSSCMDMMCQYGEFCADRVYLFAREGGKLSQYASMVFGEVFLKRTDVLLAYADEDYRGSLHALYDIGEERFGEEVRSSYRFDKADRDHEDSRLCAHYRGAPWFKPDFSPDTLASFFYIGSVFAVRGSQILEMVSKYGSSLSIYELVYRIFVRALDEKRQGAAEGIVHIPRVLYTNDCLEDAEQTDSSESIRALYQGDVPPGGDKVSIIIPSKDHAQILKKCLETLVQNTNYGCYEIIIVDNGSDTGQKMCITQMIEAVKRQKRDLKLQYLYREREFNFSAMCNAGARLAQGAYLLFLNDDIEAMDTDRDWLGKLVTFAAKSHVGAVGAKLYYPGPEENGCYRIQHAGITNMGIGPAHKLGGMADTGCLYHGHNTCNYDMLAVTAACMLIRKSVFDGTGGFDETFPVAYNDVELCFRLYQAGYLNVQVNEAALIHHESLSRGQDTSPEKQRRLTLEKQRLYQKYPSLYARDPFYSPNLVQWKKDVAYNTGYLYDFDKLSIPVFLDNGRENDTQKRPVFKKYDFRRILHVRSKTAAKVYDRLTGFDRILFHIDSISYGEGIAEDKITDNNITDNNITIEGWSAVRNRDNAQLPRKLWLIHQVRNFDYRSVYEFEITPKLREDVAAVLESGESAGNTRNTALSGIQINIKASILKPGSYQVGVRYGSLLVCDTEKWVHIPPSSQEDDEGA